MLTLLQASQLDRLPDLPQDFLNTLDGPKAIYLPGQDRERTRVLLTLTHGNEPSGFLALHQWLREGRTPLTNILVILGGVKAAQHPPLFTHRYVPGQRDLNRCFNPPFGHDRTGELAQQILQCIRQQGEVEAVVDMHNTSGLTPPFAVCFGHSWPKQQLAGLFTQSLVVSELQLGSLMEQDFGCPTITVEVGGDRDPRSLITAQQGIEHYFLRDNLLEQAAATIFRHPLRLELIPPGRLNHEVTIREDIEQLNFTRVGTESPLGQVKTPVSNYLQVRREDCTCDISQYFVVREGQLYPKHPMVIFMATTQTEIATSDCLFYFCVETTRSD